MESLNQFKNWQKWQFKMGIKESLKKMKKINKIRFEEDDYS